MLKETLNFLSRSGKVTLDPYFYVATWNTFGIGATTPVNVNFDNDSDFELDLINIVAYVTAGNLQVDPDFLLAITDSGSGRNLQSAPVHVHNLCGDGFWPGLLPEQKLVKGGSVFVLSLTNLTGVAINRVDVLLGGRKVFYNQGFNRSGIGIGI